ncbi:MAG: insulinase family protein [Victivallales bacterium]|nr:insulinase family protein [Victivallales bacterium]MCF7888631.1 insulinase family protein [Victivallales bacterium]
MKHKSKIYNDAENNGFQITETIEIIDINATAYRMIHKKSGAGLIYLNTEDRENLFSIAFKTPPPDNSGLPHILEHTVLTGSENYPLKDPFVGLLKTSVATFLNAMTYPDKTVYPCASMNEQDFHNILRIYCDAVFFPIITKEHFQQEGYHYEFEETENPESNLTVKGVVFNEMRGVYSDLNGIIAREESKSLYPDNAYGKDSGGIPEHIINLTYDDFKNFHKYYYHPSNAYFLVYGSFPVTKTLEILDKEYLTKFSKIDIDTYIAAQKSFTAPVTKKIKYPISANESKKNQTAIIVNFKTNCLTDTIETLALTIIENYLLGNSSSPLRKALIDSNIGESLTSSGYADYQRDTFFTVGMKGCKKYRKDDILDIIFNVCRHEVKNGFNKDRLAAAFQSQEFSAREITSSYPLNIMDRVYNYWLYNADPFTMLNLNYYIEQLKKKYNEIPFFFEKILEKYILKNVHYSVLIFRPDNEYSIKKAEKFRKKMDQKKALLSDEEKETIVKNSLKLHEFYALEDSKEALDTLPKLKLKNISEEPVKLDSNIDNINDRPFITTDIFSNRINYLTIAVDLRGLDEDLLDFLPIFKLAVLKMGAGKFDYLEMAERENLYTGGVSAGLYTDGSFDNSSDFFPLFKLSSKATVTNTPQMLNLLQDKLQSCRLDNKKRLKNIIIQRKSALRTNILNSGSSFALSYASRNVSINHNLNDRFIGINHIRFISKLSDNFDAEYDNIVEKLSRIKSFIKNRNRIYFSYVGDNNTEIFTKNWAENLLTSFDSKQIINRNYSFLQSYQPSSEAVCLPAEVAYNALSFPAVSANTELAPPLFLIGQYLNFNFLWEKIRVENGAYGASSFYSVLGGIFGLATYRDPFIMKSYDTFYKCTDHILKEMKRDETSIEQIIIGSLKKLDKPIRPENAVNIAVNKYLRGVTDQKRYEFRQKLLNVSYKDIENAAQEILINGFKNASVCTISNQTNVQTANKKSTEFKFNIEFL